MKSIRPIKTTVRYGKLHFGKRVVKIPVLHFKSKQDAKRFVASSVAGGAIIGGAAAGFPAGAGAMAAGSMLGLGFGSTAYAALTRKSKVKRK